MMKNKYNLLMSKFQTSEVSDTLNITKMKTKLNLIMIKLVWISTFGLVWHVCMPKTARVLYRKISSLSDKVNSSNCTCILFKGSWRTMTTVNLTYVYILIYSWDEYYRCFSVFITIKWIVDSDVIND